MLLLGLLIFYQLFHVFSMHIYLLFYLKLRLIYISNVKLMFLIFSIENVTILNYP